MWVALLVLLVPVFCREAIPSIVVTPYRSASYGTTAIVIQCTVSSSSVATSVGWGRVSIIDNTTEDIDASNSNGKYHIIDSMINPHLTINNIVFSDETNYVCFATNVAGTGQSNYGILNVTSEIPSIIATPLEQFPVVGSTKIVIECNISSSPTAISVGWQRTSLDGSSTRAIVVALSNGKYHVDNSLVYPHLTINDVSLADDAYYVCFATNVVGKGISNSARVDVIDTPLTVHAPVSEYSISVGTTVTMQCSVTSGIATSIKWLKNNEIIVITENPRLNGGNSDYPSLIISSVEEDDLGYYICQATNGILTVYSDDIFLVPKDIKAPLSIKVNTTQYSPTLLTSVTLNCEITTGKAVSVRWLKNDDVIVTADNPRFSGGHPNFPSLRISQVEQNDFGYYICQASDGVKTVNTDTIALSPKGTAPIVDVAQKLSPPIIGQEFIISCTIDSTGSNLQKVQWIFKDLEGRTTDPIIISTTQPFKYIGSSVNNPPLTINNFQSSDVGSYMCRAINDWGSSVSSTTTVYSSGTTIQTSFNVAGNLIGEINDKSSCSNETGNVFCVCVCDGRLLL